MVSIGTGVGISFLKISGGVSVNPDFVSTWDTTQAGSASDTVVLPLLSGGTYSGTIDWGDGSKSVLSYANRTHVYAAGGTYTITISGSDIQGFQFNNAGDKAKITDISNCGNLTITTNRAFFGCSNLSWSATDAPTIATTSLTQMFQQCGIGNADFTAWDVSGVTQMEAFILGSTNANPDMSTWDVSNLVDITLSSFGVFAGSSLNTPMANWNVSSIINFSYMFTQTPFNQPIDNWDVTGASSFRGMFRLNSAFNQNIGGWDMTNATDILEMLNGATSFDQDLSSWNIVNITNATNFMASGAGLSTANYDATLIGWEAALQAAYPSGAGYTPVININFGSSQYTLGGAAEAARTSLITNFGWTISDGGGV